MEHREFIRQVPGSDIAVLMVHGIAGTPKHFNGLLPVIPQQWSVYNILLSGHGGTVKDFGAASMEKWKAQVKDKLRELLVRYRQVVLVAHSMGTLFAIQAAIDHPDKIPFLFLLNVPTRPQYPLSTVLISLRVAQGKLRPEDRAAREMRDATSVTLSRNLLAYLCWIPRFWELLRECRRVRKLLPKLKVPADTFQSQRDELVHIRSVKDLENHDYINNTVLLHSGHFAYQEPDLQVLQNALRERIKKLLEVAK